MILGKVIGTVVCTQKDRRLTGFTLLVVAIQDSGHESEKSAPSIVAVDTVGAGVGEQVLVVMGSPAAKNIGDSGESIPVDATVIGIVDTVEIRADV